MSKFLLTASLILMLVFVAPLSALQTTRRLPAVADFSCSYATGATNQTVISVTARAANASAVPGAEFKFWLSDSPTGLPVTTTAASGAATAAVTILGHTGMFNALTTTGIGTNSIGVSITNQTVTGITKIGILDSAKTLWYPVFMSPTSGVRTVCAKLATANYAYNLPAENPFMPASRPFDILGALLGSVVVSRRLLEKTRHRLNAHGDQERGTPETWRQMLQQQQQQAAPAPREQPIGTIAFKSNAYGTDLFGPNGGFPLETYEELIFVVSGLLTVAGGTTDGTPTDHNPQSLIKAVEVNIGGVTDAFVQLPLKDLQVLNRITNRFGPDSDPDETRIEHGGVQADTPFGGTYRLRFTLDDLAAPYKGMFPSRRFEKGTVKLRVKFGTGADLVAGGDRTKTISSCTVEVFGREHTGDGGFDFLTDLVFNSRSEAVSTAINATANPNGRQHIIPRVPALLYRILIYQFTLDSDGAETSLEGTGALFRPTDKLSLVFGTSDKKFDQLTWGYIREMNKRHYGRSLPNGYACLDMSPRGDEVQLTKMLMTDFSQIVVNAVNASVANANVRFTVQRIAAMPGQAA